MKNINSKNLLFIRCPNWVHSSIRSALIRKVSTISSCRITARWRTWKNLRIWEDIRPLLSADYSKTSMVCPYTNGYWKRNGKESWKTYSTPKCESLKSVTDTDSTLCLISHTSVKTLLAIPHALYAKKQPAVRKSERYNKQSHPTNVPISCTMRAYWLAYWHIGALIHY